MNRPFWSRTRPPEPDNCETIDPLLSLYADGMASAEESGRVESHLPDCAFCRQSLLWMQATRLALASRPVMSPPVDLRARIARSIAATDAAPVRTFRLRPAYAAAASLTVLGVAIGYSLLKPHPANVPSTPALPQVMVSRPPVEPIAPSVPVTKPSMSFHGGHLPPKSAPAVNPVHRPEEHIASIRPDTPDDTMPTPSVTLLVPAVPPAPPKIHAATPAVKPHPRPILRKQPLLPTADLNRTASNAPAPKLPTDNPLPVKAPENKPPDTIASANVPPAPSPENTAPVTVAPPEPSSVRMASISSDPFEAVRNHAARLRQVELNMKRPAIREAVYVTHPATLDASGTLPIALGDLQK